MNISGIGESKRGSYKFLYFCFQSPFVFLGDFFSLIILGLWLFWVGVEGLIRAKPSNYSSVWYNWYTFQFSWLCVHNSGHEQLFKAVYGLAAEEAMFSHLQCNFRVESFGFRDPCPNLSARMSRPLSASAFPPGQKAGLSARQKKPMKFFIYTCDFFAALQTATLLGTKQ